MDAILYTSNTGFTEEYAKLLQEKTGLPAYRLSEAKGKVADHAAVLYLGWLMAGRVSGYKKACKRYQIAAVCGVGMAATGSQIADVRKANAIVDTTPVFTLQGGFDLAKLHGMYRFMMNAVSKGSQKKLSKKPNRTPEESDMLDLMQHGGSRVSEENLAELLDWMSSQSVTL